MAFRVQIRRDPSGKWLVNNPILLSGEFGYETDTTFLKIGDGATPWNYLPYWEGGQGPVGPTGSVGPIGPTGPASYKVFTALLTQSGGDDPDSANGGDGFSKGWTYYILANPNNEDLTPYGAPDNNEGTYFICNSNVSAGIFSINLKSSYNRGAPIANVLENTIGDVWFTYEYIGIYKLNSNSLFGNDALKVPKYENVIVDIYNDDIYYIRSNWEDSDTIEVQSRVDGANTGNSLLNSTFIEIRVYN